MNGINCKITYQPRITPVLLLILDGFGHSLEENNNAIVLANTPNWDKFCKIYEKSTLHACAEHVGLPAGQFGNSEVGHLNLGAGRIIEQDLVRIDKDIAMNKFGHNPVLRTAIQTALNTQQSLHIIGLLSDGGVHSHEEHIYALIKLASESGVTNIHLHVFLDGRDTPPKSAVRYLQRLEQVCKRYGACISSICGRYYAMDRDNRWERMTAICHLLSQGISQFTSTSAQQALYEAYERGESDEFVPATAILNEGKSSFIQDGDAVVFMNFRADRMRQLVTALTDPTFTAFSLIQPKMGYVCSLTRYSNHFSLPVVYDRLIVKNSFGEYLSKLNYTQLRIAETEKYPHVTYFFNGGQETPFPNEDRILISSPKVATYDMRPEMSADEITQQLLAAIASRRYDAIICNYANGDMVGHTGKLAAAIRAVETLDLCMQSCVNAMQAIGGEVVITADHGNCEIMWDVTHDQPHTQHTMSKVPFLYIGRRPCTIKAEGALQDVAPSLLTIMGLPKPEEMLGHSLIDFTS